ncbi:MAG: M23 family metallopeptidase [Lachnospiraceae bacterium]|nr:M23 family metallopeptidase [Lachnospiraceae bacterium]
MKKKKLSTILKEKAFLILLLVSILCVAGIAAINFTKEEKQEDNQLFVDREESTKELETTTVTNAMETQTQETPSESMQVAADETAGIGDALLAEGESGYFESNLMDATDEPITESTEETVGVAQESVATEAVDGPALQLNFNEDSKLKWPIEGNVILDYSMNATVYFSTLKQYKYNPAILIQGEVNTPVVAAADGIVTEISSNEEIGDYVVMTLGNDYQLVYGQLKALEVAEGDSVEKGQLLGYISEPTKYYVVEGSNLYLELLNGTEPVDPLDFME